MGKKITGILLMFIFALPVFAQEITGDIFGQQRRNIHPAASLSFQYTDNLYNADKDKESDFLTVFSPSIALSVPGSRTVDIAMASDTGAPGGLSLSRDRIDSTDRYHLFMIYNPKAEFYADNSDENLVSHTLKAAAQYNAPGGLTLDLASRYAKSSEVRGEVGNRDLDEYKDMLLDAIIRYDFSPKMFVRGGFSVYDLDYDREESAFRNRRDLTWSVAAGYRLTAATELALEYQKTDVDYDRSAEDGRPLYDSQEERVSANLSWRITAKSRGRLKIGQIKKSMDKGSDADDLFAEFHLAHQFTTRTRLDVAASRRYYETNFADADYYISDRIGLVYSQELTPRIKGKMRLDWNSDSYSGSTKMENDIYRINPSCEYSLNNWLSMEAGYSYETRNSTYDNLEYDTNKFYFSITGQF